ncbi:hypothetical protein POTOM_029119 [Populus tomentosa]|uniref:Uncharacterized protein n=1 Tax=Populus tomentosa TaxID=118781 RepID=A0A8X7Z6B9_POPTO|nr:hypothetical protein POTOM_029117 [Populus tomentosa]KAG6765104.1 hypothetical protein POTOM_029119 [Populus tomentosa]
MLGFTSLRNIAYQNYQLSASLKRLAVTRSWPLGCLPILTAFSSYQNYSETWNIASKFHNQKLQREQGLSLFHIDYSCGNFDRNGAKKYVVCDKPENDWHESSCLWNPHFVNSIRNIQRKKLHSEEEN